MKKGFTLLELLTVIIIITILSSVGIPAYLNYVRGAQTGEAKTTVGAIYTAQKIYRQNHGRYLSIANYSTQSELFNLLKINPSKSFLTNWRIEINYQTPVGENLYIDCYSINWKTRGRDFCLNTLRGEFEEL